MQPSEIFRYATCGGVVITLWVINLCEPHPTIFIHLTTLVNINSVRLLYCYPDMIDDGLIAEIRDNPKIAVRSQKDVCLCKLGVNFIDVLLRQTPRDNYFFKVSEFGVISLGCDKNRVDTEKLLSIIKNGGCEVTGAVCIW